MEAFILVNTEPGLLWKVAEESAKISGVKIARAVTGQFDVIVFVELEKLSGLSSVIEEIQGIEGFVRSQTSIAMPVSAYTLSP